MSEVPQRPGERQPPVTARMQPSAGHRAGVGPLKAIGWALLGIRSSSAHQHDAARVSPLVWIGSGLVAVVVFVLALIVLVRWLVVPAVG